MNLDPHPRSVRCGAGVAFRLIALVTSGRRADALVGDLVEQVSRRGRWWFWFTVARLLGALAAARIARMARQGVPVRIREGATRMEPTQRNGVFAQVWRRKALVLACVAVAMLATNIALSAYPARYEARSELRLVPAIVAPEQRAQAGALNAAERLEVLAQSILSRTRLERIISEFDLYEDLRRAALMEDVVAQMRRDIALQTRADGSITVAFTDSEPRRVQQVTERLTSLLIQEELQRQSLIAEFTERFLENEIEFVRTELTRAEASLDATGRRPATRAERIEVEVLEERYRSLLLRRQNERTNVQRAKRQLGEQLRLTALPTIPRAPVSPDRVRFNVAAAAAGLGLGCLVAMLAPRTRRWTGTHEREEPGTEG